MVLSNKKLKQKLRAELADSLTASATAPDPNSNKATNADPNPQTQSLRELLDSLAQKPRLSKREKRRKTLPLKGLESSNSDENKRRKKVEEKEDNKESEENKDVELVGVGEHSGKSEKKKKRKRDEMENGASGEDKGGDGIVKEAKESKKKKNKKKKKKKKKTENGEEKIGSQEQGITETNEDMDSQVYRVIPTKIYVGGIPYHYSEDDIRSYFRGCGTITEVDCKMCSEDGKFSGIAFITFETEDAATRALALDRAAMGERFLTIQQYIKAQSKKASDFAPEMVEGYNRIYVGNLTWDITEDDLRKLFSDCSITSIRIGMDKETGEFQGYAHVDFKDSVSMAMALKLNQGIVCGRPIKISCAVPKKGVQAYSRSVPTCSGADNGSSRSGADNGSSRSVPASSEVDNGSSRLVPTSNGVDNGSTSSISGKIRRRTCYECGEKGHLSSACPKKQNADPTN